MANDDLIAETNRLIARVLQNQEEQRAEAKQAMQDIEERTARLKAESEASMNERLKGEGLPPEGLAGTSEDWERRRESAMRRSQENIETLRQRDEAYKTELLDELRLQSDLLRRIAERLER